MDWHQRIDEIQSNFFDRGLYTYLHVSRLQPDGQLTWSFSFLDLGMGCVISRQAIVVHGIDGEYWVDNVKQPSEALALEAVFAGHYTSSLDWF